MMESYQYIPYLWLQLFAVAMSSFLSWHAWRNRSVRGAVAFSATMLLVTFWTICQALEFAAVELSVKIVWANLQYLAIMCAPAVFLVLVLQLTDRDRWLRRRWAPAVLIAVPALVNLLVWTNAAHELMWHDIVLRYDGIFPLVGKTFGPLFWPAAVYNFSVTIASLVLLAIAYRQETALYRRQIGLLFVAMLIPVLTTAGHVSGVFGIGFDITPVIFGFSGLLASWGIFRYRLFETMPVARSTVIETMSTGVIVMDGESRILDMNAATRRIFAVSLDEVTGMPIERLFGSHPELLRLFRSEQDSVGELVIEHDGATKYYEVSFEDLLDSRGRPLGTLFLAYDITRRKEAEELVRHMAFHDGLTGLPNRQYFYELCSRELILAERRGEMLLIAFMDLDGFKAVNDSLGHEAGDRFLCRVANRLTGAVRKSDVVSRLGGDEFAILIPGIRKDDDIEMLPEKIYRSFTEPVRIGPEEIQIRASMGISVFPRDGRESSTLLKKADTAMYVAKKQGKNHYHLYSGDSTPGGS